MLFGSSTVVAVVVIRGICVLGFFLRIWVVFVYDLPIIV
jgi:hypothetical protein